MAIPSSSPKSLVDILDQTTIISLASTIAILALSYAASQRFLPRDASTKLRIIFVWHAFDALIHFCLEAGFLYNCFFSYIPRDPSVFSAYLPPNVHFLGRSDRLYGPEYGTNPLGALWRVYAQADARWGGSDLGVISLEILTVFVMAPITVWALYCLATERREAWFWMIVVATGELYGGFMTFAPEWLSGNPNLDTSNWMYMWVYLFFFNMLWVWLPLYVLYQAYFEIAGPTGGQTKASASKRKTR